MSAHAGIQYPQPSRGSRRPYSIDMLVAGSPAGACRLAGRRPGRWRAI